MIGAVCSVALVSLIWVVPAFVGHEELKEPLSSSVNPLTGSNVSSVPKVSVEAAKGFELFDTTSWIKGERELQVLQMRALKGQLEKEITQFEKIQSASVILDLAFETQQPKASVILSLEPHVTLGPSDLQAIAYHLSGAVLGLQPHRIAICDTKGNLYQTIDRCLEHQGLIQSQQLKHCVAQYLNQRFDPEHFHCDISVLEEKNFLVHIVLEEQLLQKEELEKLEHNIQWILQGFGQTQLLIETAPLKKTVESPFVLTQPRSKLHLGLLGLFFLGLGVCLAAIIGFRRKEKVSHGVDFEYLSKTLAIAPIESIVHLLSYMEEKKAQKIIHYFPKELKVEVLNHLHQLSQEEL